MGTDREFEFYSGMHLHFFNYAAPESLKEIVSALPGNFTVADLGCGDGALLFALSQAGCLDKAARIIGIDLSEDRISNLQFIPHKIEGICSDVCQIDRLPDETIDLVISTQVIEHVSDDIKLLREVRRILKENGKFYIDTVVKKWYGLYFYRNGGKFVLDPTHLREYKNINELQKIFSETPLKVEQIKISQLYFPVSDLILRLFIRMGLVKNIDKLRMIYIRNRLLNSVRTRLKIPILGYNLAVITGSK